MSVDFFDCVVCGESVCECGDYVGCECGRQWCSDECAEEDGYKANTCKLGYDVDDNDCEESCCCCDNELETSCNYCREDDFEDSTLLAFTIKMLQTDREELIKIYKKYKEEL